MRYIFRPHLLNTLITLILLSVLVNLGFWQLNRAAQKTLIQTEFESRQHQRIDLKTLNNSSNIASQDLRFFKVKLRGKFDNQHFILLDNKIVNHQIGYELYVPFRIIDNDFEGNKNRLILVDRGFIPQGPSRQVLPVIEPILGEKNIEGILNTPPSSGLSLGADENTAKNYGVNTEKKSTLQFPLRVSKIDLIQLELLLQQKFYTYILIENNNALHIMSMKPERHVAYAVQWFMLAGTLFILYLFVSIKKRNKED